MLTQVAHVFIVDARTFPVHLEYQFAGTTAGVNKQRSIGLYADIGRVRPNDRAYFGSSGLAGQRIAVYPIRKPWKSSSHFSAISAMKPFRRWRSEAVKRG